MRVFRIVNKDDWAKLRKFAQSEAVLPLQVTIETPPTRHSDNQRAYAESLIRHLALETGLTSRDEIAAFREFVWEQHLGTEQIIRNAPNGTEINIRQRRSSAKIEKETMSEVIESIIKKFTEMGYHVPTPEEMTEIVRRDPRYCR